ncbi:PKD domain-containing protein [Marinobacterium aestuariivivens]|uniref:PKD domain-containing protein n=1 Tax=Marinobacterium aestuariivivens TaxID=1698799 RepID=A0ABW2A9A3_9GAMM
MLSFDLVVDDGKEFSAPDTVDVTVVENSAPIANAGPDQTVDEATLVALDGTASSDPDGGDTLSFDWAGPVALDNNTSPTPTFTAPFVSAGGDTLTFTLVVTDDDPVNPKSSAPDSVTIHVQNINDPPSCHLARAVCPESKIKNNDDCTLWPPNHKLIPVNIAGVTDVDNNDETLQITAVTQDEPVNAGGDGDSSPDAVIQIADPADSVLIRAERTGLSDGSQENGRVYVISFVADDGFESCTGAVTVGVPHDRKDVPVDDGQSYDSTLP